MHIQSDKIRNSLTLRNSGSSTFISVPLWSSSRPRWHRFSPSYKPAINVRIKYAVLLSKKSYTSWEDDLRNSCELKAKVPYSA